MAELIQQATLVNASTEAGVGETGDVLIDEGKIVAIAPTLSSYPANTEIIDARGQFLGPGLIDLYSQSGEPGHESRETHHSIQQAALAGGFTRVGLLPNTNPVVDNVGAITTVHKTNRPATPELMPWVAITQNAAGQQLNELSELADAGALGFADGVPLNNPVLLRRLLEYAQPLQKPIALWPCERAIAGQGSAREGVDSLRLGLAGVSAIAETTALAILLEYLVDIPTPIHIMRVSTARSVELIRQAKSRNLPVTASVAWHHLLFSTQDLAHYNPNLRHNPPLGTPADQQVLIEGVAEGVIDAIATDHSPYTYEEKTVAFGSAPPGAIGLELAFPVLWQTFVTTHQWSPLQLWNKLSLYPAKCLGLKPGQFSVGAAAELTLFDPTPMWEVNERNLQSRSQNTPWCNQTVQGKVTKVWTPTAHQSD